jgi:hypothetical protein
MARLPDDEIQRRYEENLAHVEITDQEALVRWPDLDPETRDRRRQQATTMRAKQMTIVDDETGQRLVGGKQPRKTVGNVLEAISTAADERQKEVVDGLFSGLHPDESAAVRGKAAERIVRIKSEFIEQERRDREELRQLGKDELIDILAKGILEQGIGGDLMKQIASGQKTSPVGQTYDADGTVEAA